MKKLMTILLSAIVLCGLSTKSFSDWDDHYHYREGHYYRDAGWWSLDGFIAGLAVGSYVESLPPRYETVVVGGVPYYYADGYYYQVGPSGYVVVAPPAGQGAPIGNSAMAYLLGILFAILLIAGIVLLLKKLFEREGRPA